MRLIQISENALRHHKRCNLVCRMAFIVRTHIMHYSLSTFPFRPSHPIRRPIRAARRSRCSLARSLMTCMTSSAVYSCIARSLPLRPSSPPPSDCMSVQLYICRSECHLYHPIPITQHPQNGARNPTEEELAEPNRTTPPAPHACDRLKCSTRINVIQK